MHFLHFELGEISDQEKRPKNQRSCQLIGLNLGNFSGQNFWHQIKTLHRVWPHPLFYRSQSIWQHFLFNPFWALESLTIRVPVKFWKIQYNIRTARESQLAFQTVFGSIAFTHKACSVPTTQLSRLSLFCACYTQLSGKIIGVLLSWKTCLRRHYGDEDEERPQLRIKKEREQKRTTSTRGIQTCNQHPTFLILRIFAIKKPWIT